MCGYPPVSTANCIFNPPAADKGLIARPGVELNFPIDIPLLAAG